MERTGKILRSTENGKDTFLINFYESNEYVGCKWIKNASIFKVNDLVRDWQKGKINKEDIS